MSERPPQLHPQPEESEEERRVRLRQEVMERMLLDQEETEEPDDPPPQVQQQHQQQQQQQQQPELPEPRPAAQLQQQQQQQQQQQLEQGHDNDNDNINNNNNNNEPNDGNNPVVAPILVDATAAGGVVGGGIRPRLSYTQSSFLAAVCTVVYALRSRGQWYLALVYLSSSKWAFCVLGNALVALAVQLFGSITTLFLQGGLRLHEAEGLQDFFRWNVTETCLALTMFRSELTIGTACEFLGLVLAKCLHHVAVLRQDHLRMTDDAIRPASWNPNVPTIPFHHVRVFVFLVLLQLLDLWALQYLTQILLATGPSVSILFAFEAAILLVSAWSHLLLWHLHVLDGLLHFAHDLGFVWGRTWLHTWKEHKATLTFAVELQAQAVQFLFYLSFFGFVLTYYGVPINLFREVYVSFSALKERLVAFFKYRKLMAGMNRFANPTEEQLEHDGRVCIICRDEMTVHDSKQLPVCKHLFHKSCLREWLTQQQSCPTCRSDIAAMQRQENTRNAAVQAAAQRREVGGGGEEEEEVPAVAHRAAPTPEPSESHGRSEETQPRRSSLPPHCRGDPTPTPTKEACCVPWGESETKEKTVRFAAESLLVVPNHTHSVVVTETLFPALYRVVKGTGAQVWYIMDEDEDEDEDKNENDNGPQQRQPPFVIRTIPLSVVVFGQREQVKFLPEYGPRKTNFVRIPDGWVSEDEILRVYTLKG